MRTIVATTAVALLLVACASQPTPVAHQVPGFLVGFFRGFIAILSLIGSLFLHIRIYEFPNRGFWYDFGFVAGFCTSLLAVLPKDTPKHRPVERRGTIVSRDILGGLHYQYCRI